MPIGIKFTEENCERIREYAAEMGVTPTEAVNKALKYFFTTVGLAEREYRAETAVDAMRSRRGMS